ncbi:unnamed protein product [Ectocarpus sp. 12 AP-2014]
MPCYMVTTTSGGTTATSRLNSRYAGNMDCRALNSDQISLRARTRGVYLPPVSLLMHPNASSHHGRRCHFHTPPTTLVSHVAPSLFPPYSISLSVFFPHEIPWQFQ